MKITPKDWNQRRKHFLDQMKDPFERYERYVRWRGGDFKDVLAEMGVGEHEGAPVNMVALVAQSFRAHLFFNAPKIAVKPVPGLRKEDLAKAETRLGNEILDETEFYWEGRKGILDGFLGPYMVFKIGYSADISPDVKAIRQDQQRAQDENIGFLAGKTPRVRDTDSPGTHIPTHDALLEDIEGGIQKAPPEVVEAIKKHNAKHREKNAEPTFETVRSERVWIKRRNPLHVQFDLWSESLLQLRWVGESCVRTLEEVQADERYDKTVRDKVTATSFQDIKRTMRGTATDGQDFTGDGISRVLVHEYVDNVNKKLYAYAHGDEDYLRDEDCELHEILPNGPYVIRAFQEDLVRTYGIPLPAQWEPQHKALSVVSTVQVMTAKASVPGIGVDLEAVDKQEIEDYKAGKILRVVGFKGLGGRKISEVISSLPQAHLSPESFAVGRSSMELIERLSMMGATRLSGGDTARTATASALIDNAIAATTQEAAVLWDRTVVTIVRYALRIAERFYTPLTVTRIAGDAGSRAWREFSVSEILDDRGVEIIPGTMRRASTDIEVKLMTDMLRTLTQIPHPSVVPIAMKLIDHIFTVMGVPVDLSEALAEAKQLQAMPMGGGGGQAGGDGAADMASLLQGVANVGGGQVPTGAGEGDGPRMMR